MRKKIGECLVQAGLIREDDLQLALGESKRAGERLGLTLVRLNLATEKQIAKALALQLGLSYINLLEEPPDPAAVVLIAKDVATKKVCLGVRRDKGQLTVAMADPLAFSLLQDLEFQTGYRIKQVVATPTDILEGIERAYPDHALISRRRSDPAAGSLSLRQPAAATPSPASLATRAGEEVFEPTVAIEQESDATPIVNLVDDIIESAIRSKASDVHIEPAEKSVMVRHRLDGLLQHAVDLPKWAHEGLIARLKILSGMDIAEKRLPQDGRLRATAANGAEVDFRVSTLRTLFGEKIVMRVLDQGKGVPSLDTIGLSDTALCDVHDCLRAAHGMILVVGPTGSGKTTTLSSALTRLQSTHTNIITIEDPIEYQLPGVNQTQVNDKIKLTFASALRSILRQDPDVILVGEIRDAETAKIAMQAAQTGHLVLSTLHTDDAPSAITRLVDLGTEHYVIASALVGVVAQRLVRRLCVTCRRRTTPSPETAAALHLSAAEAANIPLYEAVGCASCHHTGYRGRIGIYQVMRITDPLRRLIAARASDEQIRDAAFAAGMLTLGDDGLAKVKAGVTTAEELLRVVTEVRDRRRLCGGCGAQVGADFVGCPQCGQRLTTGCPQCGRSQEADWKFCPYCTRSLDAARGWHALPDQTTTRPGSRQLPASTSASFPRVLDTSKTGAGG